MASRRSYVARRSYLARRSYVARHRHGRPGLFHVTLLTATWPPLRPVRPLWRRWFARRPEAQPRPGVTVVLPVPMPAQRPATAALSRRAA